MRYHCRWPLHVEAVAVPRGLNQVRDDVRTGQRGEARTSDVWELETMLQNRTASSR